MKLLIGGSPCTYWSIAQTKNRETEASGMGWELFKNYCIARDKFAPDYFLYENNKSMSPAIREQITAMLGVEPVCINSALVSAQNRQRLYWVGKRNPDGTYSQVEVPQPEDRGILLRDILEKCVVVNEKGYNLVAGPICVAQRGRYTGKGGNVEQHFEAQDSGKTNTLTTVQKDNLVAEPVAVRQVGRRINEDGHRDDYNTELEHEQRFKVNDNPQKTNCLSTVQKDNMVAEPIRVGEIDGGSQGNCIYSVDAKSVALTSNGGGKGRHTGLYAEPVRIGTIENDAKNPDHDSQQYRVYSPDAKGVTLCGNGGGLGAKTGLYAVPTEISDANGKTYTVYEVKDGLITIKGKQYPIKLKDGYYIIRKLTVTECKRLQTVPDSYEFPVSDSQAYKMLGNGWTVEVIVHIMSHMDGLLGEPVEVLSMYDGMACGHIALDKLGATIQSYTATEIDKYAIKTATHNFPDIQEIGDAFAVRDKTWYSLYM